MKKVLIVIALVVVVAAVVLSIVRSGGKAEAEVEIGKVVRKDLTAIVNCSGTIEPKRKVDVSANAMGTIVHLAVAEGQRVEAGDLLLEIDPSEYRAAVKALEATISSAEADLRLAEASLDKARQDRRRTEDLFDKELTSEENLITARTNQKVEEARVEAARHRIDQYRANLASAHHDLDKVTITAPMTGLITRLNVEEGENAIMGTLNNPGTVLLTIADLGTMEAWVEVDETEVVKLALDQEATISIDAFPEQEFSGRVTEIGNSPLRSRTGASREAVDFEVKITLDDVVENVRPGLSAKAEIHVAKRQNALAVPLGAVTVRQWPLAATDIRQYSGKRARQQRAALADLGFRERSAADSTGAADIERKDTEGVFVIRDDFAKFVPVKIGIAGEDDFELLSGVDEGETVVTGPFRILRELKDGSRISVAKPEGQKRGDKR